ncbi:MAG: non-canonical purine NTP pyrophosphatase [Pirellulaceae bacterium]
MTTAISPPRRIVLGTSNAKKCLELRQLLEPLGYELLSLAQVDHPLDVDETGQTFMDNAAIEGDRASQASERVDDWRRQRLVRSLFERCPRHLFRTILGSCGHRRRNNEKLLYELRDARDQQRDAYYISTIALSDPSGQVHIEAEGRCWGRIIDEYRGSGGFGYDPLFEIREYHRTFAELGATVKGVLSHRGRALQKFIGQLCLLSN